MRSLLCFPWWRFVEYFRCKIFYMILMSLWVNLWDSLPCSLPDYSLQICSKYVPFHKMNASCRWVQSRICRMLWHLASCDLYARSEMFVNYRWFAFWVHHASHSKRSWKLRSLARGFIRVWNRLAQVVREQMLLVLVIPMFHLWRAEDYFCCFRHE